MGGEGGENWVIKDPSFAPFVIYLYCKINAFILFLQGFLKKSLPIVRNF